MVRFQTVSRVKRNDAVSKLSGTALCGGHCRVGAGSAGAHTSAPPFGSLLSLATLLESILEAKPFSNSFDQGTARGRSSFRENRATFFGKPTWRTVFACENIQVTFGDIADYLAAQMLPPGIPASCPRLAFILSPAVCRCLVA